MAASRSSHVGEVAAGVKPARLIRKTFSSQKTANPEQGRWKSHSLCLAAAPQSSDSEFVESGSELSGYASIPAKICCAACRCRILRGSHCVALPGGSPGNAGADATHYGACPERPIWGRHCPG